MQSELSGRLRNTNLAKRTGLMPVYEAVINSIEAIEERNQTEQKKLSDFSIKLEINRIEQLNIDSQLKSQTEGEIHGFRITDDGIGFTDKNWESFRTLDSLYKVDKGCRGIGRLMWLKAFDNVAVSSTYAENGEIKRRDFTFNIVSEVSERMEDSEGVSEVGTTVNLLGFKKQFASATRKTLTKIASGLLEHCLWYFIRAEGVPQITVCDNSERIDLFELFDAHMYSSSANETIHLKDHMFEITHVKVRADRKKPHMLAYCASGRLVDDENITGKIPGLYTAITDTDGQFTYMAYLTGSYLDERVTNERVRFNISETSDDLFSETEISYKDIRETVYPRVSKYLETHLEKVLAKGRERVDSFVATKAPKYRPLLKHIPAGRLSVDPRVSEKELEILLHKETFEVEKTILKEGHELLSESADFEDYADRLASYMNKVTDLGQSGLANYVAHRRVVIDLLEFAITKQEDKKFVREDVIHELIVPMRVTSSDSEYQRQSLWLVDERLAFHHFLASDLSVDSNPTTKSESAKKPDIATLRVYEIPLLVGEETVPPASITVIEIKRPMRGDYQAGKDENKDPILQSLDYLRRLREGARTVNGRPIPNAKKIPGFVYVLADLTDSLVGCCKLHQLQTTADGMGYFGYHSDESYNAYIQVMSFDGLVKSAKERNRAFFDKLGLSIN